MTANGHRKSGEAVPKGYYVFLPAHRQVAAVAGAPSQRRIGPSSFAQQRDLSERFTGRLPHRFAWNATFGKLTQYGKTVRNEAPRHRERRSDAAMS